MLGKEHVQTTALILADRIRQLHLAADHLVGEMRRDLVIQDLPAGRLVQITVQQQDLRIFLGQCQGQIGGNRGLTLVLHDTGDQQDLALAHALLHPTAKLAHGGDKAEAGLGIADEDASLFPGQDVLPAPLFLLMPDLAQAPAAELFFCLLLAADHILEVGTNHQHQEHTRTNQQRNLSERLSRVGPVDGGGGDHRRLQDLQNDISHDRIGDHVMLFQQDIHHLEGGPGIPSANLDGHQVGLLDIAGMDTAVEAVHSQLIENIVAHDRAVEHLREHRRQIGSGVQIVIDRGGAVPRGQDQGTLGRILGDVHTVRIDIRRHRRDQGRHQDQHPFPAGIQQQHDRIEGEQRFLIRIQFFFFRFHFHPPVIPRSRSAWQCRNGSCRSDFWKEYRSLRKHRGYRSEPRFGSPH